MQLKIFYQTLLFAIFFIRTNHSTTVTLTVEGGVSLVGPHCPGTVRLFCEGVGLHLLRWTYNEVADIVETIQVDSHITTYIPTNSAFVSVTTTSTTSITSNNPQIANFSSILTVNLLELRKHNIRNISCGDLSNKAIQGVNVEDYFTATVTASYQFGILNKIEVKLYSLCLEYNRSSVIFKIGISGPKNTSETRSCGNASCSTTFNKFPTKDFFNLILMATNYSHKLKDIHLTIAYHIEYHLEWTVIVNSTSCQQITVQCAAAKASQNITACDIRHRADDDDILNTFHLPINTQQHLPYINHRAVHHFELLAMLKDNLLLVDTIIMEPSTIEVKEIFILVTTSLFLLMALTHLFILFLGAFCKTAILTSMKVAHLSVAVILFVLILTCVALLFVFGITANGKANDTCTRDQKYFQKLILNVMIAVASTGIILVVLTWTFMLYRLYKYREGMRRYEGACHTLNETTNAKSTDTAASNRDRGISESVSMSNQYYHPGFSEMPRCNRRARGSSTHSERSQQQQYDMLEHSKDITGPPGSDYPNKPLPKYTKLNKETMDGPNHYTKPHAQTEKTEWPVPVLDRAKRYYSNVRPERKLEAATTTPDITCYTGLSECYILDSHSARIDPYNISPSNSPSNSFCESVDFGSDKPRDSFYESVDLHSEIDYQNSEIQYQPESKEKPKSIPLPPRNIRAKISKPEPIEEEYDQQQSGIDDYQNSEVQHQLRSGKRPKPIPIPPRRMRRQEPIVEESNVI